MVKDWGVSSFVGVCYSHQLSTIFVSWALFLSLCWALQSLFGEWTLKSIVAELTFLFSRRRQCHKKWVFLWMSKVSSINHIQLLLPPLRISRHLAVAKPWATLADHTSILRPLVQPKITWARKISKSRAAACSKWSSYHGLFTYT